MIRRYYQSCVTIRYALLTTVSAVAIFIFAFFTFRTGSQYLYYGGVAAGIWLICLLAYVQFEKYRISRQVRNIAKANRYYDEGGMIGRSFVLDDTILVCDEKLRILEISTSGIKSMRVKEKKKEKREICLGTDEKDVTFLADNGLQAERLAAFLQTRNPGMAIDGIKPSGNGTLASLKQD